MKLILSGKIFVNILIIGPFQIFSRHADLEEIGNILAGTREEDGDHLIFQTVQPEERPDGDKLLETESEDSNDEDVEDLETRQVNNIN